MTLSVATPDPSSLLITCIEKLGTAILPIWGVKDGVCLCPKGKFCNAPGKHPNGKYAPQGVKSASRDPAIVRQWARNIAHSNWALRCGEVIPGGGYLGVFDFDPRNGADEALADLASQGRFLPETVTQSSGGGGGHRLYRFPVSPASRSLGPGLDLQGGGKYIVIAPSLHVSGGFYAWDLGASPGEIPIANAPQWMIDGTDEAQPRPTIDGGTARDTVLGEAFTLAKRNGPIMPDGTMFVNCVQSHLHSDARGRGEDASTVILPPAGGSQFGGYKCLHGHCANLKWDDIIKLLPKAAVDAAFLKYPRLSVVPNNATAAPTPVVAPGSPLEKELAELRLRLHYKPSSKNGSGNLKNDIVNASVLLTYDPRWKDVLCFDEFAQSLKFLKPPPWHPDDAPREPSTVWKDNHITCLDMWYRRNWQLELNEKQIRAAVYMIAQRDSVNPLKTYLDGLIWDGTPRLDTWLHRYAGVQQNDYVRAVGSKWLISAVARGYRPGCSAHHVLILEGPQGRGKSTLASKLVPDRAWFSDTPLDLNSKDAYMALRGRWILELAELASLKKTEIEKVKSFFTSPVDNYRPPYGHVTMEVPRSCVFMGTVNQGEYLQDPSGARRFWPVRVGVMDTEALEEDRDQLWAETVMRYKTWIADGSPDSACLWWPSMDETAMFEEQQALRQLAGAGNPWTEAIAYWASQPKVRALLKTKGHLTVRDIAAGALEIVDRDLDSNTVTNIGLSMTRDLGWEKHRMIINGAKTWGYRPC